MSARAVYTALVQLLRKNSTGLISRKDRTGQEKVQAKEKQKKMRILTLSLSTAFTTPKSIFLLSSFAFSFRPSPSQFCDSCGHHGNVHFSLSQSQSRGFTVKWVPHCHAMPYTENIFSSLFPLSLSLSLLMAFRAQGRVGRQIW